MPSTARSTCIFRASATRSRTIRRSRAASSRSAVPATCLPRSRIAHDPEAQKILRVKRLYLQIYLTIVVILVIATVAVGLMSRFAFDAERFDDMMTVARELAVKALPPPDAPRARQQEAIERLHDMLRIDLALYAPDGALLAAAGRQLP